jgi:hypothetical protein
VPAKSKPSSHKHGEDREWEAVAMRITLLGHASLVVEMDGAACLMDSVFYDRFEEGAVVSCPRRTVSLEPAAASRPAGRVSSPSGPFRRPLAGTGDARVTTESDPIFHFDGDAPDFRRCRRSDCRCQGFSI